MSDYDSLIVLSEFCGWIYLISWSASFYPQVILNYKLKSVEGFHLDFPFLNVSGFLFFSMCYSVGFFWKSENPYDNYGLGTIRIQDLLFAYHAALLAIITGIQCFIYTRGKNKLSRWAVVFTIFAWTSAFLIYFITERFEWIEPGPAFNYIVYLGYLKVMITALKYAPLAYWNYKRKMTLGFSIGMVLFDFTGSFTSMAQNIIDLIDGTTLVLNPIKLGLGGITFVYDILLMVQHFVLYRNKEYPLNEDQDIYCRVEDEAEYISMTKDEKGHL